MAYYFIFFTYLFIKQHK